MLAQHACTNAHTCTHSPSSLLCVWWGLPTADRSACGEKTVSSTSYSTHLIEMCTMKSVQWFGVLLPCTLQPIGIGMADSHMLYAIGLHERLCISNTTSSASLCLPLSHTHTCTAVVPCCFTAFKLHYLLIQSVFCVCVVHSCAVVWGPCPNCTTHTAVHHVHR